jgi:phage FluMu protein Com
MRAEGESGSVRIKCRGRQCRRFNDFHFDHTDSKLYRWESRCGGCNSLLYRYTADATGTFEIKCKCGFMDTKHLAPMANITTRR